MQGQRPGDVRRRGAFANKMGGTLSMYVHTCVHACARGPGKSGTAL